MTAKIIVTLDRKPYRWVYDADSAINSSWIDEQTNAAPTTQVECRLNRHLLDNHAESLFEAWGKDHLPRFYELLNLVGATESDFKRLKLDFDMAGTVPGSPLRLMGYRVGVNGLSTRERQAILRKAFQGQLPKVLSDMYMERWGKPGTAKRLQKIASHITSNTQKIRREGADRSKAEEEWQTDLNWLKVTFYDGTFTFPWGVEQMDIF